MRSAKNRKGKRGVSGIVVTLILIVVAVSAGLAYYYWIGPFMASQTHVKPPAADQFSVENLVLTDATHAQITVRNLGEASFRVDAIYVNGAKYSFGSGAGNFTAASATVPVGSSVTFTLTASAAWTTGTRYDFLVSTANGSQMQRSVTAP